MKRSFDGSGHLVRSDEELKEIEKLRAKRKKLMAQHLKARDYNVKQLIGQRITTVNAHLFELTDNEIYNTGT